MSFPPISFLYALLIYWPCIICFPVFSLRTLLILLLCVECLPFLCLRSHLIGFFLLHHCCHFNYLIHIWLIAVMTFNNIYQLFFCMFCVQILCSIDCLPVTSFNNRPLPPHFLLTYSLPVSALGDVLYMLLVPL